MYLSKIFKKKQDVLKQNNITNNLATERLQIFDFLRFISCFLVCIGHLSQAFNNKIFSNITGGVAMPIFFFITGYLITMSLERCNVKQFIIKRFFRLIPVLLIATLFAVTICHKFNIINILGTIFMFTDLLNINPTTSKEMNAYRIIYPAWSMQVEVKFYIFIAISFFLFRAKSFRYKLYFTTLIVYACILFCYVKHLNCVMASFKYCCHCLPSVLIGMSLYLLIQKRINLLEYCLLLIINSCLVFRVARFYIIGIIAIHLIFIFFKNINFNKNFIKYFANLSYSLYLFHMMFYAIADRFYIKAFPITKYFYRLEFLIICILVCHFVYKYIEKPCYDFGRKLAKKFN